MKVGVFSVIDWSFLDQRPQVLAKKLSQWGHDVVYFEPFFKFQQWNDTFSHPWSEYETACWKLRNVFPGVNAVTMMCPPAHKSLGAVVDKNIEYKDRNKAYVKTLKLDLAIVIDPAWGALLDELKIPYIYDHVDDTHHMEAVLKDHWVEAQNICEKTSIAVMYIQPNIARRHGGIYVPNGIEPSQLEINATPEKHFDSGCLSAIADWFDLESVLSSKKKLLIVGPMDLSVRAEYTKYRKSGETNVTWIPRVSRRNGVHWLKRCKTAMVPFRDDHAIVDYVMPLKLVEYLYLGLPSISYLNKGIEEEFGEVVQFYSCFNWRGLPSLDEAIELALTKPENSLAYKQFAEKFTWDRVCRPLEQLVNKLGQSRSFNAPFRNISRDFVSASSITPLSKEVSSGT
jgi:glycosyltransferase involved in cell wall biosynthesis